MKQKITGIVLSYFLIVIDVVVGILFVPFLLKILGDDEYGLYKLMLSTASYLSILDFGIGGTITRYVVKFKTEKKRAEEENLLAMGFIVYGVLSLLVVLIAIGLSFFIPQLYQAAIPTKQRYYARVIFLVICMNTAVNLFNHAYNGLLLAYEKYTYQRLVSIIKVLLRVALVIILLLNFRFGIIIAFVDFSLSVLVLVTNSIYTKYHLNCKIWFHKWDIALLKEVFVFTIAILLQSIINQFNSNVDNIVLGIFTTTATVALYSIALQLYTMYSALSTAVSSIYLSSISKAVFQGEDDNKITQRVIEPSRIQLIVLLLALSGYLLFGKDFIVLWVGPEYLEVFVLAAILLVSSTLELSQNSITSVLKAKNILHGKTLILLGSTIVNGILTVVLVPKFGAVGAAAGTAFSMVFGYGVALNIYYERKAGLNMKMYYKKTYSGILLAAAIAFIFGYGIAKIIDCNGYLDFVVEAGAYVCVYLIVMLFVGLNAHEKSILSRLQKKKFKFV